MTKWLLLASWMIGVFATCCSGAELKKDSKHVVRVNCAATESYKDTKGNVWQPDQMLEADKTWGYTEGEAVDRYGLDIKGVDAPKIYETERYSMSAYTFQVPNGKYTVRLHFAETFSGISGEGERIFDVTILGKTVLKDFDPYKAAGGSGKPVCKSCSDIEVTEGKLVIGFTPNVQNPEINGIEILGR